MAICSRRDDVFGFSVRFPCDLVAVDFNWVGTSIAGCGSDANLVDVGAGKIHPRRDLAGCWAGLFKQAVWRERERFIDESVVGISDIHAGEYFAGAGVSIARGIVSHSGGRATAVVYCDGVRADIVALITPENFLSVAEQDIDEVQEATDYGTAAEAPVAAVTAVDHSGIALAEYCDLAADEEHAQVGFQQLVDFGWGVLPGLDSGIFGRLFRAGWDRCARGGVYCNAEVCDAA